MPKSVSRVNVNNRSTTSYLNRSTITRGSSTASSGSVTSIARSRVPTRSTLTGSADSWATSSSVPSRLQPSRQSGRSYSALSNRTARTVCAVSEGRGVSATVGLCFLAIDTGECVLCEISDSQTWVRTIHKLSVYDPIEILIPNTSVEPMKSKLCNIIEENIPGAKIIPIARKYYNEANGQEFINTLSFRDTVDSLRVLTAAKFYAVSSMAAALKYVETQLNVTYAPYSLRVRYEANEGSMIIDYSTIRNLELLQNIANAKSAQSLLGILNNTNTPMGLRLLKSNILQPLTTRPTIEDRLTAVEELTQNEDLFFSSQNSLKQFQDLDRLLTSLIAIPTNPTMKKSEQRTNDIIMLKQAIVCMSGTAASLESARSELLAEIRELCLDNNISTVKNLIDECINEDCQWAKTAVELRNQRCYAVRQGRNGLLDVARQTYKEVTNDIMSVVGDLKDTHDLDLEIRFEVARGYYLRVPSFGIAEREIFPDIFINQTVKKQYTEFTTMMLLKLNSRLRDSLTEIMLMSEQTVEKLIERIREYIPAFYRASESIAMLDMLISFAHLATGSLKGYVRPEFNSDGTLLAIKNARHPVKEIVMMKNGNQFVENDIYASKESSRFQIITGTNMSGKSTYLKQVALIVVMAQIGCFVPAEHGSFPIFTALHSRISADEDTDVTSGSVISGKASSAFATDMREAAFILQNLRESSLVLIDEMGRGSSTRDGLAITLAISEVLVESQSTIFFSTHFRELAETLNARPGVANLHMRVDLVPQLRMLYKIVDGRNESTPHYGLKLAQVLPFPERLLNRAEEVSHQLEELAKRGNGGKMTLLAKRRKAVQEVFVALKSLDEFCQARAVGDGQNDDDDDKTEMVYQWLAKLQAGFVERMTI
ncbi:muts domain V-domain-containing protein [Lipomyces japonicus]|uniref:muts domain V-domain-containing protein n=1 Tax=Lipomyces japonicus TaxID=56871 RepID=UPI0034CF48B1